MRYVKIGGQYRLDTFICNAVNAVCNSNGECIYLRQSNCQLPVGKLYVPEYSIIYRKRKSNHIQIVSHKAVLFNECIIWYYSIFPYIVSMHIKKLHVSNNLM